MTKEELLGKLEECRKNADSEAGHIEADDLLIEYIADEDIAAAFDKIERWYA